MKFARRDALFATAGILGGVFFDFLCNGVGKIGFWVIYIPIYLAVAATIDTGLSKAHGFRVARTTSVCFLLGAVLGHIGLVGHAHVDRYEMRAVEDSPLTLGSDSWPQRLVLSGDRLSQAVKQAAASGTVPVVIRLVTDYGCVRTRGIATIAGADVERDPQANWTWTGSKRGDDFEPNSGPGAEDRKLIWCRIRFF